MKSSYKLSFTASTLEDDLEHLPVLMLFKNSAQQLDPDHTLYLLAFRNKSLDNIFHCTNFEWWEESRLKNFYPHTTRLNVSKKGLNQTRR